MLVYLVDSPLTSPSVMLVLHQIKNLEPVVGLVLKQTLN